MKKVPVLFLLLSILISTCSCNQPVETREEQTSESVTESSTESTSESTTEITKETIIETTESEVTETEFVSSLPNMRIVEYDGLFIPDGCYLIDIKEVDSNGLGLTTRYFKGLPYFLDGDIDLLNEGDTFYFQDMPLTVQSINRNQAYFGISCEGPGVYAGLSRSYTEQWYLSGDADYWYNYSIADEVHLNVSEDVVIFDGICPYYLDEETHQSYIESRQGNTNGNSVHFYQNLNELIQVRENSGEYPGVIWGGIFIIVKNQMIIEMVINPDCHQSWRYRGTQLSSGYEIVLGSEVKPILIMLGNDYERSETSSSSDLAITYSYKDVILYCYSVNGIEYIKEVKLLN